MAISMSRPEAKTKAQLIQDKADHATAPVVKQQKSDEHHGDGGAGGTRSSEHGRQQAFTAFDQQRALTVSLMEQVCDPKNLLRAYRRVLSNKGEPGVDGMTGPERRCNGLLIPGQDGHASALMV
jgi:hypothetical protein